MSAPATMTFRLDAAVIDRMIEEGAREAALRLGVAREDPLLRKWIARVRAQLDGMEIPVETKDLR